MDPDNPLSKQQPRMCVWAALSVSLPSAEFVLFAMHCHVCVAMLLVASHSVLVTARFLAPVSLRRYLSLAGLPEDREVAGG